MGYEFDLQYAHYPGQLKRSLDFSRLPQAELKKMDMKSLTALNGYLDSLTILKYPPHDLRELSCGGSICVGDGWAIPKFIKHLPSDPFSLFLLLSHLQGYPESLSLRSVGSSDKNVGQTSVFLSLTFPYSFQNAACIQVGLAFLEAFRGWFSVPGSTRSSLT